MRSCDVQVKSMTGLHARPGTGLVELALTFSSDLTLTKPGSAPVNAKEVLDVLMGDFNCGDRVSVAADGHDEDAAIEALTHYIETTEG